MTGQPDDHWPFNALREVFAWERKRGRTHTHNPNPNLQNGNSQQLQGYSTLLRMNIPNMYFGEWERRKLSHSRSCQSGEQHSKWSYDYDVFGTMGSWRSMMVQVSTSLHQGMSTISALHLHEHGPYYDLYRHLGSVTQGPVGGSANSKDLSASGSPARLTTSQLQAQMEA